jgi:predicted amidohydrolase
MDDGYVERVLRSVEQIPRGEVLASLGAEPGLLVGDIDPAELSTVRATIPVLANRRDWQDVGRAQRPT